MYKYYILGDTKRWLFKMFVLIFFLYKDLDDDNKGMLITSIDDTSFAEGIYIQRDLQCLFY